MSALEIDLALILVTTGINTDLFKGAVWFCMELFFEY